MKILGLACDVWISSAALIEDGEVVAAVAEERFNRQKMSKIYPRQSIDFCLKKAGVKFSEIDRVVFAWNPALQLNSASSRYIDVPRWRGEYLYMLPGAILNQFSGDSEIYDIEQLINTSDWNAKVTYVNHHLAHAASTYLQSPYNEAAILTLDGRGEEDTSTFNLGNEKEITKLSSVKMPHSMGLFYASITDFLGFKPHTDEWKVMALASYGRQQSNPFYDKLRGLIKTTDGGGFEQDLTYFSYYNFDRQPHMYSEKLIDLLGPVRTADDPFDARAQDISAALQMVFTDVVDHMLHALYDITGTDNLCLAGGAAMNSVYNGTITERTPFKSVFIPSCPDDSGVSVGAALYAYHCLEDGPSPVQVQTHNSWGPSFDNEEIKAALDQFKIRADYHEDIEAAAAKALVDGQIIGWFQGAMEFGQRALGNRSILADPRSPDAKDKVNAAVKFREGFRPFAPAILEEFAKDYFVFPPGVDAAPFMERVLYFKESVRSGLPAVVHEDGTGRLQTVGRETSPQFYRLIELFQEITNVPIVLNTSFNLNGEPVVCSPTDAIRSFYTCGLDALFLGNFLVQK